MRRIAFELLLFEYQLVLYAVADDEQQHVHDGLGNQASDVQHAQQLDAQPACGGDDGNQQVVAHEGAVAVLRLEDHLAVDQIVHERADGAGNDDRDERAVLDEQAQQEEDEGYDTDEYGNIITKKTISVTRTDYVIVPEDYDGLLMSVYVADWVSVPQDEDGNGNDDNKNPNREPVTTHDPEPFDDEENIDDYVFFGVTGPQ